MGTQKLVLGVLSSLLLVGCADGAPSTGPVPTPTVSASSAPAGEPATGGPGEPATADPTTGASSPRADDPTTNPTTNPTTEPTTDPTASEDSPGLEMPEAPGNPVVKLSELLGAPRAAPLVGLPLPRAASASGRLVAGFPAVLRPTRSALIETSSVSPSGDRLQVALVASTSLAPDQVLVAYRGRLGARGLVERKAPPAVAGSLVAAFTRGRSVVTLTVTPAGSGTTYVVHASLRADRG